MSDQTNRASDNKCQLSQLQLVKDLVSDRLANEERFNKIENDVQHLKDSQKEDREERNASTNAIMDRLDGLNEKADIQSAKVDSLVSPVEDFKSVKKWAFRAVVIIATLVVPFLGILIYILLTKLSPEQAELASKLISK